jgi:hypothetical protein
MHAALDATVVGVTQILVRTQPSCPLLPPKLDAQYLLGFFLSRGNHQVKAAAMGVARAFFG